MAACGSNMTESAVRAGGGGGGVLRWHKSIAMKLGTLEKHGIMVRVWWIVLASLHQCQSS